MQHFSFAGHGPFKVFFANTKDLLGVTRILWSFSKVYSVTMTRCLNEIGSCCDWPFPIFFKLFPPFKPLQLLDCDKIVRSSSASNSYVRFVILFYATAFWSLEILHPKCKHLHDDAFGIWKDVFDIFNGEYLLFRIVYLIFDMVNLIFVLWDNVFDIGADI